MKRTLVTTLLVFGILLLGGTARADTFTLNKGALLLLWDVYENPVSNTTSLVYVGDDPLSYGANLTGQVGYMGSLWDPAGNPYSPFSQIGIGGNFWGVSGVGSGANTATIIGTALGTAPTNSLVGFDKYALTLYNDNDDIWWVNIFINTGYTDWGETNNFYENGWVALNPGAGATLVLDLSSVANLHHVTNIGFAVGGNLDSIGGNPSNPDYFHISASPVPEPSSLLLLGFGLLAARFVIRRKR